MEARVLGPDGPPLFNELPEFPEAGERYARDVFGEDDDIGTVNFQHRRLLAMFGTLIGELWSLDALAGDCARDGVYELFLVAKPLNLTRGVGSHPNATALSNDMPRFLGAVADAEGRCECTGPLRCALDEFEG